ncbi:outer membrane protein [Dongshaea marina]|uniref:outer membrane protein n=1 Tax=Dongshaea marina TaxID=2047966 RepID=UPI000D3E5EF0|nr:outer membrane beta-barrel protein [Dongshaea marina]
MKKTMISLAIVSAMAAQSALANTDNLTTAGLPQVNLNNQLSSTESHLAPAHYESMDFSAKDYAYINLSAGYGENSLITDIDDGLQALGVSSDRSHLAYSAAAGFIHNLNADFGLGGEAAYNQLDELKAQGYDLNNRSIDLAMVAMFHASKSWDIFFKGGASYQYAKLKHESTGWSDTNNSWVPMAGFGVGYNLTQNIAFNLTVNHYFGKDDLVNSQREINSDATGKVTSYLAGVRFKF